MLSWRVRELGICVHDGRVDQVNAREKIMGHGAVWADGQDGTSRGIMSREQAFDLGGTGGIMGHKIRIRQVVFY